MNSKHFTRKVGGGGMSLLSAAQDKITGVVVVPL